MAVLVLSCGREKVPILSEKAMEDVLFDYHLAISMARMKNVDSMAQRAYIDAVYEKHGISQAVFDSSMVFYAKHTDKLHGIYEHLSDRFTNEGRLQGVESNGTFDSFSLDGDTANIWSYEPTQLLTTYVPSNMMRYHYDADTTFLPGDRFIMTFYTDFLSQSRASNGFALFTVRFDNDSAVVRTKQISNAGITTFEVSDDKRLGVKTIDGYFILRLPNTSADHSLALLKIMILSDIKLIRMHTPAPEIEEEEVVTDSIIPNDTLRAARDTIAEVVTTADILVNNAATKTQNNTKREKDETTVTTIQPTTNTKRKP